MYWQFASFIYRSDKAKKKINPPTSTNEQVFCCEMINHDANEKYNTTNKNMNLQRISTREFVPAEKKDDMYWFKRVKNTASARKSRMKKQAMDNVLRKKMMLLWSENLQLRSELANTLNTMYHRRPSQNRNISSMTPVMKEEEPYESVRNFNKYTTSFISSERRIEDANNIYSMKREMRHYQADNSLSFMEDGFTLQNLALIVLVITRRHTPLMTTLTRNTEQ